MDIDTIATTRYATKAYDPHRRIGAAQLKQLKTLLRYAPSSVNSQPWHFVIAASDEARKKIATATTGPYSGNEAKVLNASHVVVLCRRAELDDAHLQRVLAQEEADGRFPGPEARAAQIKGRGFYVDLHRNTLHDTQEWMEKQVYLALGTLLLGAATLAIDATPIEGFDRETVDKALALNERELRSVVLVALGYRSDKDLNAELPKSRLLEDEVFTFL
ncbi:MAG: oxygen-insensitive NAD(P)H nitroreductase [Gammaproteobacteria bacterium]|nr:oxygen-insensitive NAD(P)H nitroreductase [Gammaproteobacteria bacterium]MCW8840619.1 oxygen-insensitive NAD(P)H nitroreductase [Gammaproteobacteria bacterium]MCW8959844.1 oxygen-insensitive NAD(P)H nitroreductase [Gammaproteobacteria bacterium]MCW8972297.1 oxygen-insensitive NAD(P)H nitroreductase [Gammaproteobacteria bacterium]MCW8992733.1 oxygen-insensitive NAD(P)H nitroreductase [Gammaproteobacteria bacterium]